MKKICCFLYLLIVLVILLGPGLRPVKAETEIWGDKLTVAGFLRYEMAIHITHKNPNNPSQDDNNWLNLSRAFFQTEWEFKPFDEYRDNFKLYSKIRLIHDQTEEFDSNLNKYDAFPRTAPSELQIGGNDEYQFEVWELYSEIDVGNLWLRIGRQQIVWGEMIAARIMDIINPLDLSWHFRFEPEEFENIRIPLWSLRALYTIEQSKVPGLRNLNIECFLNPGDIAPDVNPEPGAPFNFKPPYPPFFIITEKDRRGDVEYGVRIGGSIGQVYGTINYLHLYTDSAYLDTKQFVPVPLTFYIDAKYPSIDVYGLTLNYAFAPPIDLVTTFEGTYIPNQPYMDANSRFPGIQDRGTFNYAIRFDRKTFVFPRPTSAMMIQFQLSGIVVEGDEEDLLIGNQEVDKSRESLALILSQAFFKADLLTPSFQTVYDIDGAYYIKPQLKFKTGDHWVLDVWGVFVGGSEKRPERFGGMYWADEVVLRATYQF